MIAVWTLIGGLALACLVFVAGLALDSETFAHWIDGRDR